MQVSSIFMGLFILWLTALFVRYTKNKNKLAHIPGITQLFWIQHPFLILGKVFGVDQKLFTYTRNNLFVALPGIFERLGSPVVKFSTGQQNAVYVNDVESVKKLGVTLRNEVEKPMEMYKFVQLYGPNLISSTGDVWKRHRKIANNAFTDSNLKLVAASAVRTCHHLFKLWAQQKAEGRATVNIPVAMESITLAVISEAAFGHKLDVFELGEYPEAAGSVVATGSHRVSFKEAMDTVVHDFLLKFFMPKLVLSLPFAKFQKVKTGFEEFESYLKAIVQDRQRTVAQEIQDNKDKEERGEVVEASKTKPDCLNLLIMSQQLEDDNELKLTDEEIMDEGYIFLFAGHETTASTLCWAFTLLVLHPEHQQKVYEEVMEVLGPDRDPTYEDLPRLIYTKAVFFETLRLWPAVVTVPKRTQVEVELGGYKIPAQTTVFTHMYSLHRNPKYWEDPDEFRPSRFDERVSPKPKYGTFAPFSIGPRRCLGNRFAEVEGTLLLAMLLRKFTFHLQEGADRQKLFETRMGMTVIPKHPLEVLAKPRKA